MAARRILIQLLAIGGVAGGLVAGGAEREPPADGATIAVEEILANPLDDAAYGRSVRCLSTGQYRRIEIIGNRVLAFHGRGGDVWLNVLTRRCPGLRRNMTLLMEVRNLRICTRDLFRGLSRASADFATVVCVLGEFKLVQRDNIDAVRDALVAWQRTRAVAATIDSARRAGNPTTPEK